MRIVYFFLFSVLAIQTLHPGEDTIPEPSISVLVQCSNNTDDERIIRISAFNEDGYVTLPITEQTAQPGQLTEVNRMFPELHKPSWVAIEIGEPDNEESFETADRMIVSPGALQQFLIEIECE